jgi:uncharacterized protein (DUF2267 family)
MSASGLDVFDRTLETTHVWLNEICNDLGPDKQLAWKVLSTVLHKLRDRLTVNLAAHLGAQLPLLIRGVYFDQFEPGKMPSEFRSRDEFVADVAKWLSDSRPVDPEKAIKSVFRVMSRHISEGQISKIRDALPKGLRQMWEAGDVGPEEATDARTRHEERQSARHREEQRNEEPLILTDAQAV